MESRLNPEQRRAALEEMTAGSLDVLVVGGGVVGAGAALDAVTRGLSVGLVEMGDWGSGASSASSMVVNGGLSHLSSLELTRLRSAVRERGLLFGRIAPHLVQRVPFLFPLRHGGWERAYLGAALSFYDAMGHSLAAPGLPGHRHLTRRSVRRIAPGLRPDVVGGVQYYGAQVDDARYVLTIVRTAAAYGVLTAGRVRVEGFLTDSGRVCGVRARDLVTDRPLELRARVVLAAVGGWTDELLRGAPVATGELPARPLLSSSLGLHLVVPRDRIRSSSGIIAGAGAAAVTVVPWGRHWVISSTPAVDEPAAAATLPSTDGTGGPDRPAEQHPVPTGAEVDGLLGRVNQVLGVPLTRADVQACYAGRWPRLASAGTSPPAAAGPAAGPAARRSEGEHRVVSPVAGLVAVAGGSFSTYRLMAVDAVDAATRSIGGLIADSITDQVPLMGADGYAARWNQRHLLARRVGLHVARVEHLLNRYGAVTDGLLDLVGEDPSLAAPVAGAEDYLAVEVVHAVTHEGATDLVDVLARRTRIAIETWDGGAAAAASVAQLMSGPLGWDREQTGRQVAGYRARPASRRPPGELTLR